MLLSGLNLAIFVTAKQGTWRNRFPSIFVDIARVLHHRDLPRRAVRLDLGRRCRRPLHRARHRLDRHRPRAAERGRLGAVGLVPAVRAAVRARRVHRDLGGQGSRRRDELAGDAPRHRRTASWSSRTPNWRAASFTNLTRASIAVRGIRRRPVRHRRPAAAGDRRDGGGRQRACPSCIRAASPYAVPMDKARYEINIPLTSPGKQYGTLGLFRTRLWYAARRAGLHLDRDLTDNYATPERVRENLLRLAPRFQITPRGGRGDRSTRCASSATARARSCRGPAQVPDGVRVIISRRRRAAGARAPRRGDPVVSAQARRPARAHRADPAVGRRLGTAVTDGRALHPGRDRRHPGQDPARPGPRHRPAIDHRQELGAKARSPTAGVTSEPDPLVSRRSPVDRVH